MEYRIDGEIEVVDYGIELPDYFQGHGCTFTEYQHAYYGIGDTAAEALDDAFEQAAQCGFVITDEQEQAAQAKLPNDAETVTQHLEENPTGDYCEETPWYHVGIRFNLVPADQQAWEQRLREILKQYHLTD